MRRFLVFALLALGCSKGPGARAPESEPALLAGSAKESGRRVAPCSIRRAPSRLVENAELSDVVFIGGFGGWFNHKDEVGSSNAFGIAPGGFGGSKNAARMRGKLAKGAASHAGMGISLGSEPFDASMYKGVSFRARAAADSTPRVRFTVSDIHTEPAAGYCKSCRNHFGADLRLAEEWQEFSLSFDEMQQAPGWGDAYPALLPNAVYALGWAVTDQGQGFDVWVDDVLFIGCQ